MTTCPRRGRDFSTSFWGPSMWRTLHVGAVNYRPSMRTHWYNYLKKMLPSIIPCSKCRNHYTQKEKRFNYKQILKSRENLMRFLVTLHNEVNRDIARKLNRKYVPFSFRQHCQTLLRNRSKRINRVLFVAKRSKSRRRSRSRRR